MMEVVVMIIVMEVVVVEVVVAMPAIATGVEAALAGNGNAGDRKCVVGQNRRAIATASVA